MDDVIADIRGKGKGEIENLLQKIFFNLMKTNLNECLFFYKRFRASQAAF